MPDDSRSLQSLLKVTMAVHEQHTPGLNVTVREHSSGPHRVGDCNRSHKPDIHPTQHMLSHNNTQSALSYSYRTGIRVLGSEC